MKLSQNLIVRTARERCRSLCSNPSDALPAVLVLLSYLVILVLAPPAIITGDSPSYKDPFVTHNLAGIVDSLTGHGLRQIFPVAANEILGNYRLIISVQLVTMGTSAAYLVRGFSKLPLPPAARLVTGIAAAAIVASPSIAGYGVHILSEAWTLVFTMAMMGAALRIANSSRTPTTDLAVMTIAGIAMSLMRVQLLPLWLLLAVATWWLVRDFRSPRLLVTLLTTGVIGLVVVIAWWQSNLNYWQTVGTGRGEISMIYQLTNFSPIAPDVAAQLSTTNPPPRCLSAVEFPLPRDPLVPMNVAPSITGCPAARRWADSFESGYIAMLLRHPTLIYRYLSWGIPRSMANPTSPPVVSPVPKPLSELVMGSTSESYGDGVFGAEYSPGRQTEAATVQDPVYLMWLAALICLLTGWRPWRGSRWLPQAITAFLASTVAFAMAVFSSIAIPDTILEMARLGVAQNLAVRTTLLWALALLSVHAVRSLRSTSSQASATD